MRSMHSARSDHGLGAKVFITPPCNALEVAPPAGQGTRRSSALIRRGLAANMRIAPATQCRARPGVEIASEVDADLRRTEVARTAPAGQMIADGWRRAFIAKGWTI